jgi:hypothetical protein
LLLLISNLPLTTQLPEAAMIIVIGYPGFI